VLGLKKKFMSGSKEPLLVVASKTLVGSWEVEIAKFFGTSLKYQIINDDPKNFTLEPDTLVVIVTPETASKFYKDNMISEKFITKDKYIDPNVRFPLIKNVYGTPKVPYLRTAIGGSIIYQRNWACLIIDEGHRYTNVTTARCQALGAICSRYRWILSGTMFDEPKVEKILGYYVILHWTRFPRDIPEATKFIRSPEFRGTRESIVEREETKELDVKVNKHIIQHTLSEEEGLIYVSMKKTLVLLRAHCRKAVRKEDRKKFSSYILGMIVYLRQSVVVPLIPFANIALEMSELNDIRSELSVMLMDQFKKLNLKQFLNSEESARSSRIANVIKVCQKHNKPTDKLVVFSCFCTSLDMIQYYINEEVPTDIYHLKSSQSIDARTNLIDDFQKSKENSILLGSFDLLSEGLNLQCANVVVIVDFWWNSGSTRQSLARVIRSGQMNKEVDVYFFCSNTGIEKAIFAKQSDKILCLEELKSGPMKTKVRTLTMNEVLTLIDSHESREFLNKTY